MISFAQEKASSKELKCPSCKPVFDILLWTAAWREIKAFSGSTNPTHTQPFLKISTWSFINSELTSVGTISSLEISAI